MGIRANTGTVDIDVNENGDKISFCISDNIFLEKLSDFFEWFFSSKEEIDELESQGKEISDFKGFKSVVEFQKKLSIQTMEKLNELFDADASKKIFGDVSPTYICVVDVIMQLFDEIERIAKEHNQIFTNRYSRRRKGAKS